MTSSLEVTEAECAARAVAPRISLSDIEGSIGKVFFFTGADVLDFQGVPVEDGDSLAVFTVCLMQMQNGFIVVGKSAPADARNFDAELGQKLAREDAIRQLWPLMGYQLRSAIYRNANPTPAPEVQS